MLRKHLTCLAAIMVVALVLPASADFDDGMIAFKQNDFEKAIEEWQPLAESGHVMAQYNLGLIYLKGLGVARSYDEAMKHFQDAAAQGEPMAQFALGLMYSFGQGSPRDYVQAYKWISLAVTRGYAPASRRLKEITGRMSEEQIAAATQLAADWEAAAKAAAPVAEPAAEPEKKG